MEWDDFIKEQEEKYKKGLLNAQETDIRCPKCGNYIYKDLSQVLTSYPPQHRYFCTCGWADTTY